MLAIPAGPDLADPVRNAALNSVAPDPGVLAAGGIVTPMFATAKRKRCELVGPLGGSGAEIENSALALHQLEHYQMGAVAAGK